MYDATQGRFLQRDPLGQAAGMDLYEYVDDTPANATDPTGEVIKVCCAPAYLGPYFPGLPAAGVIDPSSPLGAWLLKQKGIPAWQVRLFNLLPNHCWLKLECKGKPVLTTEADVGLYYVPGKNGPGPFQWLIRPRLETFAAGGGRAGGSCQDCTDCKQEDCKKEEKCLTDQFRKYPQGRYDLFGSNSNTYAGTIARACCNPGKATPPGGASRAPGWGIMKPNPAVPNAEPLADFLRRNAQALWGWVAGKLLGR
jgi:hypothetical protein